MRKQTPPIRRPTAPARQKLLDAALADRQLNLAAIVGTPLAATFGPTGMNTLLDVKPIQQSGFLACAARNACSCDEATVPDAGARSYLTV
jgi:hypothetical protein